MAGAPLEQLRTRFISSPLTGAVGVALPPGVRTVVLRSLSAEQREDSHRAAPRSMPLTEYTLGGLHLHHAPSRSWP
ncbi:MAG: hypothetical protein R2854_04735 [Caldilineaceae bacterium]